MSSSQLRSCPYCHQGWPHKSQDHDLRGFGWLDPLPRKITVSNGDVLLHDGANGRDRFLLLETKMPWEPATQTGQGWLLRALARQSNWTVRLLKGTLRSLDFFRVGGEAGIEVAGHRVTHEAVQRSTVAFLSGLPWTDPQFGEPINLGHVAAGHVCGFALIKDQWVCAQDYYAKGADPTSGCGSIWTPSENAGNPARGSEDKLEANPALSEEPDYSGLPF